MDKPNRFPKRKEAAEKMTASYSAIRLPLAAETADSTLGERYPRVQ